MRYLLGFILSLLVCSALMAQKQTMVYLEHSETLSFDEEQHPDAQLLKGNVIFRHDSALMYCDSAYFYEKTNSLDAFGHIRMVQGDTLRGYGDILFYDGNRRFARLRNNVRLEHTTTILLTDSLNYDRQADIAWYFSTGTIIDNGDTLSSYWGQYTPYNKQALFKTDVLLTNKKFNLMADSLKYNTDTHIADLVGKTDIVYDKETHIVSNLGWYNTNTEQSMLLERSTVTHDDGKSMVGDTIYYDKKKGWGKAIGNIQMRDTVNKVTLYGNYSEAWENNEKGFATDSALLVDWSEDDNYTYMHADTLFSESVVEKVFTLSPRDSVLIDSVMVAVQPDTLWRDTDFHLIRAYHGVRVYRSDVQAICDSLAYYSKDSIMHLFGDPVCWNEDQQMSSDKISVYVKDGTVDYVHGEGNALVVKQESSKRFDQMSGKEMKGYVKDEKLSRIDVNGNAETIVFPREEDGSYIGMNRTQSSYVKLYIKDDQIDHVVFTTATTGVMYPLEGLSDEKSHLSGFFWADDERPKKPGDVFLRPQKTHRPEKTALSATTNEDDKKKKEDKNTNRNTKNNRLSNRRH